MNAAKQPSVHVPHAQRTKPNPYSGEKKTNVIPLLKTDLILICACVFIGFGKAP